MLVLVAGAPIAAEELPRTKVGPVQRVGTDWAVGGSSLGDRRLIRPVHPSVPAASLQGVLVSEDGFLLGVYSLFGNAKSAHPALVRSGRRF